MDHLYLTLWEIPSKKDCMCDISMIFFSSHLYYRLFISVYNMVTHMKFLLSILSLCLFSHDNTTKVTCNHSKEQNQHKHPEDTGDLE